MLTWNIWKITSVFSSDQDRSVPWQRYGIRRSWSANQYDINNRIGRHTSSFDTNFNDRKRHSLYSRKMEEEPSHMETNNNVTDSQKLHEKWAEDSGKNLNGSEQVTSAVTVSLQSNGGVQQSQNGDGSSSVSPTSPNRGSPTNGGTPMESETQSSLVSIFIDFIP